MKRLIFVLILILVSPVHSRVYDATQSTTHSITIDQFEEIPVKFWRADPDQYQIIESNVYPLVTLSPNNTLSDLGKAWITWELNVSNQKLGIYALYDRGTISIFQSINVLYEEIVWKGIGQQLIMVGKKNSTTDLRIFSTQGQILGQEINEPLSNIQIYVDRSRVFAYGLNENIDQGVYYEYDNFQLLRFPTNETLSFASITMGIIDRGTTRLLYTQTGNITIPTDLSNNIVAGHLTLVPTIFDLTNNTAWNQQMGYFDIPSGAEDIFFYGLRSSIVRTQNNSFWEYGPTNWNSIATHNSPVFSYAIIDIGLYLGPTVDDGLSFYVSGHDEDGDLAPDTLEDYYGASYTDQDTDDDGVNDYLEIAFGTNPIRVDTSLDPDGDMLNNIAEFSEMSDPFNADTDYGGASDGWEIEYEFDVLNPDDDLLDNDGDGVINAVESSWGSNPRNVDTDNDGLPDGWEIEYSLDPTDPSNADEDIDNDGKSALEEYQDGTSPLHRDPVPLFKGLGLWIVISGLIGAIPSYIVYRKIYETNTLPKE